MSTQVTMSELPTCDMCDQPARYDAKTTYGPWAYMCESHWKGAAAYKDLGTGKGQRLVLASEVPEADA